MQAIEEEYVSAIKEEYGICLGQVA